jgi:hypothetical protein
MGNVMLVDTIVAFSLVAAIVTWVCNRITADAAIEAGPDTKVFDGEPGRA